MTIREDAVSNVNREMPSGDCPDRALIRRVNRVYAKNKGAADRLLAQRSAFADGSRQDDFFRRAMSESCAFHFLRNPAFRQSCLQQGFHPGDLSKYADLSRLPFISEDSGNLTEYLTSVSRTAVQINFVTPGSQSGQIPIPLDARSLRRLRRAAENMGRSYRLHSRENTNYLFLISPGQTPDDPSFTLYRSFFTQLTKIKSLSYSDAEDDSCRQIISRYIGEGSALRLFASAKQILQIYRHLPHTSGWKAAGRSYAFIKSDLSASKRLPRQEIAELAGIPVANVRAVCSLPLQILPYWECEAGRLHVPVCTRVIVRSPDTLQPQEPKQTGLLQFISPLLSSCACLSLLTKYTGHIETECPCGRRGQVIIVEE